MKVNKTLIILACVFFVFAGSNLMAATLQVGSVNGAPGQVVSIPISAAQSSEGIAGAAFTITYDTSVLSPANGEPVKSDFFDTFEVQLKAANPNYTGAVEADGYDKPLVFNILSGTGIAVAAARVQAAGADDPEILFTVDLLIDSGATPEDTYDIKVIPTVLNNTNAGYDANGEEIDLLIGADAAIADPTDPNAFPVLLAFADHDAEATKGVVTISESNDLDNDGIDDAYEEEWFGDNVYAPTYEADETTDYDGDGYSDLVEYQNAGTKDAFGNDFNPLFMNAPGGNGYVAAERKKLGDLDGDGDVTVADLGMAFRIFSGSTPDSPQQVSAANVYSGDTFTNSVEVNDLIGIFRLFSGAQESDLY